MSAVPTENWGQIIVSPENENLELRSLPKGRNNSNFVPRPIVNLPISSIATVTSTTKNNINVNMRPGKAVKGDIELSSIGFAIPNLSVGYEQTEEAGKVVFKQIQDALTSFHKKTLEKQGKSADSVLALAQLTGEAEQHEDEKTIAIFDDVTFDYPSGKFKMLFSNYNLILEPKKGTNIITVPYSQVENMYLCAVPNWEGAHYIVVVLRSPVKVGATTYGNFVVKCAPLELDEEHAWKCELSSREEILKTLRYDPAATQKDCPLEPVMSGKISSIIVRTMKACSKAPVFSGENKDYIKYNELSYLNAQFKSKDGFLFVVYDALLFLHNPATKIAFNTITEGMVDENQSTSNAFQLTVNASGVKHIFKNLEQREKDDFLRFLQEKDVKVSRLGGYEDVDEEDEDDEEDDDSDEESDEENESDFDESDEDSQKSGKKRKRSEKKEKKHKKDKKDKKHKKEKKHKKDKKDKKDKKHEKEKTEKD